MRRVFLAAALLGPGAPAARAQDAGPTLLRGQADASALTASVLGRAGARGEPDADLSAEPRESLGNLHEVEPGFYRSAQPRTEDYARLRDLGVKTILNLKIDARAERERARAFGISVAHVAMSGFWAPSFAEMDRALDVLASAPRPLLVHCQHGKDRTGFVVASYRVAAEGMPVADAVAEARGAGCCFVMFGDLASYLEMYRAHRRASRPARGD